MRSSDGSEELGSVAQCDWLKESANKMAAGTTTEDVSRVMGYVTWH